MFLHFLSLSTVLVLKYNVTLCDHILNIFQHEQFLRKKENQNNQSACYIFPHGELH